MFYQKCGTPANTVPSGAAPPKKKRGCLLGCLGIVIGFTILIMIGIGIDKGGNNKAENKEVKTVIQTMELSQEQANEVVYISHEAGISKIDQIRHEASMDKDGVKVYYLSGLIGEDNFSDIILEIKDGAVFRLYDTYQQKAHFLYVNGEYLGKVTDYRLTENEQAHLHTVSENAVKELLKAPDSADFAGYDHWSYSKDDDKVVVHSYVDAVNSFGAKLRNKFWVTFSHDMQNITSININGQEMLK